MSSITLSLSLISSLISTDIEERLSVEEELNSSIPSTPLSSRSIGVVTNFSTSLGVAPG